ncbi:MAG TPA: Fe-S cluster assembly protein SufD [Rhizomicrobium sp.]
MSKAVSLIDTRRAEAETRFRTLGVPHRRIEEWKYSDLRSVLDGANDAAPTAKWEIAALPDGVELSDLAVLPAAPDWVVKAFGTVSASDAMSSASLAEARRGFALRVPRGKAVADVLNLALSGAGPLRALIVLEESASLTLVETVTGPAGFANIGIEIVLGANAQLTHIRSSVAAAETVQVEEVAVKVARDALYKAHFFNGGAKLSRLELRIVLAGENASAHLSGVSVLGGAAHADVTTHITHAVGNTQSTQLFKHVAGGRARAVYQGKITVAEGADKSDSRQTAKALLLGLRAEADLKPELEIFADDVKCAHGAAVGDLDADSLFYLRARGIPESEARNMLLRAFLEEAVAEIADEAIRAAVWHAVEDALPRAMTP